MDDNVTPSSQQVKVAMLVRKWIRERVSDESESRAPDTASAAVEHFTTEHADLLDRLQAELVYRMFYQLTLDVFASTRDAIVLGDKLLKADEVKRRGRQFANRWARWVEHAGDRHINLLAMTRGDLMQAAFERRRSSDIDFMRAMLWEALAKQMNDTEKVGDRFTPAQIEAMNQAIAGTFGERRTA